MVVELNKSSAYASEQMTYSCCRRIQEEKHESCWFMRSALVPSAGSTLQGERRRELRDQRYTSLRQLDGDSPRPEDYESGASDDDQGRGGAVSEVGGWTEQPESSPERGGRRRESATLTLILDVLGQFLVPGERG